MGQAQALHVLENYQKSNQKEIDQTNEKTQKT